MTATSEIEHSPDEPIGFEAVRSRGNYKTL